MRDLKQVKNTDFDGYYKILPNIPVAPNTDKDIQYVLVTPTPVGTGEYRTVSKYGYCSGDGFIQYPIVILPTADEPVSDEEQANYLYYPGKHGMYEVQDEGMRDNETQEYPINGFAKVLLPQKVDNVFITFTFDQVEEI